MSGNLREMSVCMFNYAGLSYTGLHGDGVLATPGNANTDFWPGINSNSDYDAVNTAYTSSGVTSNAGATDRGGNFSGSRFRSHVSDRYNVDETSETIGRFSANGGRLVHSEPAP